MCISPALIDRCTNNGIPKEKLHLIPRPVDVNYYYPLSNKNKLREQLSLNGTKPILLFVGGIIPRKNPHLLVQSLQLIKDDYPNVKLLLVGPEGKTDAGKQYFIDLNKLVVENNLQSNISFTGYVSNINDFMKAADIFLLPSDSEGFPNVLIEAMACGLPVIAKKIERITDFIIDDGKNGVIIDSNMPYHFAQAIRSLIESKGFYDEVSRNAVETVKAKFTTSVIDEKYERVYHNVKHS